MNAFRLLGRSFLFTVLISASQGNLQGKEATPNQSGKDVQPPDSILQHFAETQEDAFWEEANPDAINAQSKDVDLDGSPEWFLHTTLMCGSGGCTGPVYSRIDGDWCFVAWGHSADFLQDKVAQDLRCRDVHDSKRTFLADLMD